MKTKKPILIWIGMLFLLIDTRITGLIFYPAFEPFDTPAPISVDLIIRHLIGDSVSIDVFSDFIGYLLIMIVTCKIVNENKKAFGAFALSLLSMILYAANLAMPFFLNGEARYNVGFFLYLIYILLQCVTTIQAGFVCCQMTECLENHAWNCVVEIFVMLSAFAGLIRGMSYFYDLPRTTLLYYGLEIFFAVVYTVMYWKRRAFATRAGAEK